MPPGEPIPATEMPRFTIERARLVGLFQLAAARRQLSGIRHDSCNPRLRRAHMSPMLN